MGEDDEVHIFREVTGRLGTSLLDSGFNGMGQRPYHTGMLLQLLIWGMANRAHQDTRTFFPSLKVTSMSFGSTLPQWSVGDMV